MLRTTGDLGFGILIGNVPKHHVHKQQVFQSIILHLIRYAVCYILSNSSQKYLYIETINIVTFFTIKIPLPTIQSYQSISYLLIFVKCEENILENPLCQFKRYDVDAGIY